MGRIDKQIHLINKEIENFSEEDKRNYCEDCLEKMNDHTNYNPYLTDTGVCSSCLKVNDLINIKIVEIIQMNNVNIEDYHLFGGKRIYLQ
ncbi:hypothetical protein DBR28_09795 [Chryseobacterium sp. HMWF028]|nr:hypothetical protein DBR28_09795 [Chryseobacterium sp. HMWF028]